MVVERSVEQAPGRSTCVSKGTVASRDHADPATEVGCVVLEDPSDLSEQVVVVVEVGVTEIVDFAAAVQVPTLRWSCKAEFIVVQLEVGHIRHDWSDDCPNGLDEFLAELDLDGKLPQGVGRQDVLWAGRVPTGPIACCQFGEV